MNAAAPAQKAVTHDRGCGEATCLPLSSISDSSTFAQTVPLQCTGCSACQRATVCVCAVLRQCRVLCATAVLALQAPSVLVPSIMKWILSLWLLCGYSTARITPVLWLRASCAFETAVQVLCLLQLDLLYVVHWQALHM
jgi:hypothetical protein